MKRFLMILMLAALPLAGLQAETNTQMKLQDMPGGLYSMDKAHASLIWKVDHLGLSNYTARFTDFTADIDLNPIELDKSRVRASIDPTSIKTDFPYPEKKDFDAQLSNDAGWFNTKQFPQITFNSTAIEITGEKTGKITGDLTFLGVTKPVTLDVTFNKAVGNHPFENKPALGFSAVTSIKRSDYGMTTYIPQIGDNVDIMIEAEFIRAD